MAGHQQAGLGRFLAAQRDVYPAALAELRAGHKRGHWMWFIFPQLAGLGHSSTAQYYALHSLEEARAYLAEPTLGPRLSECTSALLALQGLSAEAILGPVDALKLRSSMTLFGLAAGPDSVFQQVLDRYCQGLEDPRTLELLGRY